MGVEGRRRYGSIDLDYCWAVAGVFLDVGVVGVEVKSSALTISWRFETLTK